jgi:membrane-associated phospholipid phosphatase
MLRDHQAVANAFSGLYFEVAGSQSPASPGTAWTRWPPKLEWSWSFLLAIALITLPVCAGQQAAPLQEEEDQTTQQPDEPSHPSSSDPSKQAFVKTFLKDEAHIWTSPFRPSSYSSHAFSKYVLPFTIITGALIATDHRTADLLPNTSDQAIWSQRVSHLGASYTLAGIAATTYLIGRGTGNRKARETGILGAEAIAHSQIVTLVLKTVTQRERPLDFQADHSGGTGFFRGGDSFPSGHASGSFALATVFAYEYGREHRWVPYASYGLASVVAASRLSGEKHWVSDIFVGSTMGFLIGRYVYKAHHRRQVDGELSTSTDRRLIPQFGITAHRATVAWNW